MVQSELQVLLGLSSKSWQKARQCETSQHSSSETFSKAWLDLLVLKEPLMSRSVV